MKMRKDSWLIFILTGTVFIYLVSFINPDNSSPYKSSPVIADVMFDSFETQHGVGADLWPVTWANDDSIYTYYGDGKGFNGTSSRGCGISKISGTNGRYSGTDICWWPCEDPTFGYSNGILFVSDTLFMLAGDTTHGRSTMFFSVDLGKSWISSEWSLSDAQDSYFNFPSIMNQGKAYAEGPDDVYIYAPTKHSPWNANADGVDCARVPKASILDPKAYEYFSGWNGRTPTWTSEVNSRQPVFTWKGKVSWIVNVDYVPFTENPRYLLTFNTRPDTSSYTDLAIFDAPNPWGPWTCVKWVRDFENEKGNLWAFRFPQKFFRNNGLDFTMLCSGDGHWDAWTTINGRFALKNAKNKK